MTHDWPVRHTCWFCNLKPAGGQKIDGGIQWHYSNYKPQDPLTIRYFMLEFPRIESEVNPWVDAILGNIPDPHRRASELAVAKQILLATYGEEPTIKAARTFAQDQIWYAPTKDFAISTLSKEQQAVLAELDRLTVSIDHGR